MRAVLGIDRKIKRTWLDALLDHMARTTDQDELRSFLADHLKDDLPGHASRAKSVGIALRIWIGIPANRVPLRDRAISLLPTISAQERIWLHWGMTSLAYPFFRDTVEVVGRLLALQDDFTTAQVQERLLKKWGDRATTKEAAQKLIHTLVDWEVLRSTKTKGHFLLVARMSSASSAVQLWLLESLLTAGPAEEVEAQQLLRLPEMFPFQVSIGLSDLRKHDSFHLHRQGLDMDMVSVRPVKVPAPAKSPKKKPAKKPKQPTPSLFREPSDEMPKKPVAQPIIRQAVEVTAVPVEEPRAKPEPISASTMVQPVEAAMPELARAESRADGVKTERMAIVGDLDLPHDVPFSAPIGECVRLFHEGLDFACIALAHDTIDAILRLICRVKLSQKQAKCVDIRSQFAGLTAIGVLPTPMKTRLEKLWYERVHYLELGTTEAFDRSALEEVASSHILVLVELVRLFLGHSAAQGKVLPDHPEYWHQGKNKLPFKAGAAG